MTNERLTVALLDEYEARDARDDDSEEFYVLMQRVTSPRAIRAALVERDAALALIAEVGREPGGAEALAGAVWVRSQSRAVAAAARAEPTTAEEYETLTEAPSTYEALLNGADAIDARRGGGRTFQVEAERARGEKEKQG